jgi:putative membrane protein
MSEARIVATPRKAELLATFAAPSVSALAVALVILIVLTMSRGPLSNAMLLHIATMNVAAPVAAALLAHRFTFRARGMLAAAAAGQIAVLWAWHSPLVLASASLPLHLVLQALLFGSALLFWLALLGKARDMCWSPLGALLVTGKLACLIGALLVFAPRPLYASIGLCASVPASLEDQQLAGLLMLTACPASYLIAGVVLASHLIIGAEGASSGRHDCRTAS